VDVWWFRLDAASDDDAVLLSSAERERASRFVFDRDRGYYIAAHAALRRLLGKALDAEPAALRMLADAYGKPALPEATLHFNLSHGGALGAAAICARYPVGIDIEPVRPMADAEELARTVFTREEQDEWRARGRDARDFLQRWTRKEAVLKAVGLGLHVDPKLVDVRTALEPQQPAAVAVPGVGLPVIVCSLAGPAQSEVALAWIPGKP
jgi:4'-phosphopantetheinyl transferase